MEGTIQEETIRGWMSQGRLGASCELGGIGWGQKEEWVLHAGDQHS